MEIIDQILKAEKQAAEIRRRAKEDADRIVRGARSNSELSLLFGKRGKRGSDRAFVEKLAERKLEWAERAAGDCDMERASAKDRVEPAAKHVVREILKGAGV